MANYSIKVSISSSQSRNVTRKSAHCTWKCAYCNGKGTAFNVIQGNVECPACHGYQYWEANINCEKLLPCNRCNQSGKIWDVIQGNQVCPICGGSGKI